MSLPSFDEWTPQRPPDDFADGAVRAMLQLPARQPRRRGRKWFGFITLAAFLFGSSTWAMWGETAQAQPSVLQPAIGPVTADASANVRFPARAEAIVAEQPKLQEPAQGPAPRVLMKAAAPVKAEPAAKVEEEPKPPPYPLQPRCGCDIDAIVCGCVE